MTEVQELLDRSFAEVRGGRMESALALALEATSLNDTSALAHAHAGALLAAVDRSDLAEIHLRRAIELDPLRLEAANNLGAILLKRGEPRKALVYLVSALERRPGYVDAAENAAQALLHLHRPQDALEVLRPLAQTDMQRASLWDLVGNARGALGDDISAIAAYRRAIAADPAFHPAWAHTATALRALGELDEARASIREAIALAPHEGAYYLQLQVLSGKLGAEDLERARAVADDESEYPRSRAFANFALGAHFERAADYQAAFDRFRLGNRIERSLHPDTPQFEEAFAHAISEFERSAEHRPASANQSDLPVFVFGMPRSGTTLVEQILASHPDVHACGELAFLEEIVTAHGGLKPPTDASIGDEYVAELRKLVLPSARRATDKMPLNFRYAPLIAAVMPKATMIHVQRDPLDTCWACYSTYFEDPGLSWTLDFEHLAAFYRAYAQMMQHWRALLPKGAMLEIRYEELVSDFETQARRIVAYCGLSWDPACLEFYKTKRSVRTASATQVRAPVHTASVGRARRYGNLLQPLAEALGVAL